MTFNFIFKITAECLRFLGSLNILCSNVIGMISQVLWQRLTIMQRLSHRRRKKRRRTSHDPVNVIIIHVDKESFDVFTRRGRNLRDSLGCLGETRLVSDHRLAVRESISRRSDRRDRSLRESPGLVALQPAYVRRHVQYYFPIYNTGRALSRLVSSFSDVSTPRRARW